MQGARRRGRGAGEEEGGAGQEGGLAGAHPGQGQEEQEGGQGGEQGGEQEEQPRLHGEGGEEGEGRLLGLGQQPDGGHEAEAEGAPEEGEGGVYILSARFYSLFIFKLSTGMIF